MASEQGVCVSEFSKKKNPLKTSVDSFLSKKTKKPILRVIMAIKAKLGFNLVEYLNNIMLWTERWNPLVQYGVYMQSQFTSTRKVLLSSLPNILPTWQEKCNYSFNEGRWKGRENAQKMHYMILGSRKMMFGGKKARYSIQNDIFLS